MMSRIQRREVWAATGLDDAAAYRQLASILTAAGLPLADAKAQVAAMHTARGYRGDKISKRAYPPVPLTDPDHGPLIGVKLHILTRKTLGGLHTDLQSRALDAAGQVIPGLYAAGEAAGFGGGGVHGYRALEGTFLGGCIFSGRAAGRAMAGEDSAYETTPIFWSDLFDDGYEAIGEVSAGLETVVDTADENLSAAVVYYLDGGRVRGVLLWNVWDSTPVARDLIAETTEQPITDPASLRGRIATG